MLIVAHASVQCASTASEGRAEQNRTEQRTALGERMIGALLDAVEQLAALHTARHRSTGEQ